MQEAFEKYAKALKRNRFRRLRKGGQMSKRDGATVARKLKDAILRMELRPGVLLDETRLADAYKVSRTPIREAIIQLIADGLVVRDGRKAKVAPLDFDEVPKLYDALLISSRLVHRLAAENRTEADLEAIERHLLAFEALVPDGDGISRSDANQKFHLAISRAAGNRYLSDLYDRVLGDTIRLARACFSNADDIGGPARQEDLQRHLARTVSQHRDIFQALVDRDVAASDAMAVAHFRLTKTRMMTVLFDGSRALEDVANLEFDPQTPPETALP
jgi:DNA-binding GntR family transcriptional regulator